MPTLVVPWEAQDERTVHAALQQLHPDVFLDKNVDEHGRLFYSACVQQGERAPDPIIVAVDWREPDGTPKPLSEGLVYEVQKMMQAGGVNMRTIRERNERLRARLEDERLQQMEEIARDFDKHRAVGNFAIVPRSQALRRSRDRIRRTQ